MNPKETVSIGIQVDLINASPQQHNTDGGGGATRKKPKPAIRAQKKAKPGPKTLTEALNWGRTIALLAAWDWGTCFRQRTRKFGTRKTNFASRCELKQLRAHALSARLAQEYARLQKAVAQLMRIPAAKLSEESLHFHLVRNRHRLRNELPFSQSDQQRRSVAVNKEGGGEKESQNGADTSRRRRPSGMAKNDQPQVIDTGGCAPADDADPPRRLISKLKSDQNQLIDDDGCASADDADPPRGVISRMPKSDQNQLIDKDGCAPADAADPPRNPTTTNTTTTDNGVVVVRKKENAPILESSKDHNDSSTSGAIGQNLENVQVEQNSSDLGQNLLNRNGNLTEKQTFVELKGIATKWELIVKEMSDTFVFIPPAGSSARKEGIMLTITQDRDHNLILDEFLGTKMVEEKRQIFAKLDGRSEECLLRFEAKCEYLFGGRTENKQK